MIAPLLLATIVALQPVAPPVSMPPSAPIQTGWMPSAYTGDFYRPEQEQYRKCVAYREGRFQYWTTGSNGRYESTYQMTDALVRGAAWMMRPELKRMFGVKKGIEISQKLLETQGRRWHRYYMDMAFYTILNWNGNYSGRKHWAAQNGHC